MLKTRSARSSPDAKIPDDVHVDLHGMVLGMTESFKSSALGFGISFALLFLILVAHSARLSIRF